MRLLQASPPAAEPLTLVEAKLHLKVEVADDDALITALIVAAREHCEQFQRRAYISQVWDLYLERFPCGAIEIPLPPLVSIGSITYYDTAGVQQTLAAGLYQVDVASEPGQVPPAVDEEWPETQAGNVNAVKVRFTAGYAAAANVPAAFKQAMKFLIGHWYEHREQVVTGTIATELPETSKALLWPKRIVTFG